MRKQRRFNCVNIIEEITNIFLYDKANLEKVRAASKMSASKGLDSQAEGRDSALSKKTDEEGKDDKDKEEKKDEEEAKKDDEEKKDDEAKKDDEEKKDGNEDEDEDIAKNEDEEAKTKEKE